MRARCNETPCLTASESCHHLRIRERDVRRAACVAVMSCLAGRIHTSKDMKEILNIHSRFTLNGNNKDLAILEGVHIACFLSCLCFRLRSMLGNDRVRHFCLTLKNICRVIRYYNTLPYLPWPVMCFE